MKAEESRNTTLILTELETNELLEQCKYASGSRNRRIREFAKKLGLELTKCGIERLATTVEKELDLT